MKAIFEPIDLKFGTYIDNIYMTHILYGLTKILQIYAVFFSTFEFNFLDKKFKILKLWDSNFVQLNILRLVMFYSLKLLDNWKRCGRLNIGLILRENRV